MRMGGGAKGDEVNMLPFRPQLISPHLTPECLFRIVHTFVFAAVKEKTTRKKREIESTRSLHTQRINLTYANQGPR